MSFTLTISYGVILSVMKYTKYEFIVRMYQHINKWLNIVVLYL